jgi:cysteine-rich repeat protein
VILTANGNATTFEDVDTVIVKEDLKQILTVNYTPDTERSKVELTWTYTGTIDFFKVQYGTDRDNLRLSLTTSTPKGNLILAEPTRAYYAQVYPVDENGVVNGQPSEVITIDPLQELPPEPICGNGEIEAGEACDDGNTINGDGCSFTCRVEVVVPPTPICGNGEIE